MNAPHGLLLCLQGTPRANLAKQRVRVRVLVHRQRFVGEASRALQVAGLKKRATTTEAALIAVNKDVVVTMSGDDSSCTSEDETAGLMN